MTIGPELKPIQTGATIHSLCMTDGLLASYKLHIRTYGGASDKDLDKRTVNTQSTQKIVNLLLHMVSNYKGCGHLVTMDSSYMGNVMAQIGQEEWGFNVVGTTQTNHTGAPSKAEVVVMKKNTHKSITWRHNMKPLIYAVWADNNIVKTLSNCHLPEMLQGEFSVKWKKRMRTERGRDCNRTFHAL
jgi:hypothetical protein